MRLFPASGRIHPEQRGEHATKLGDAGFVLAEKADRGAQVSMLTRWSLPAAAKKDHVRDLVARWSQCRNFASPFDLRLKSGLLPGWETLRPDQIDLDHHLRHSALPKPGGERELGILASRRHPTPLDRRRPLWEIHVIEGREFRYLNGARTEVWHPISLIFDDQAMNITFISYVGRDAVCFTACRDTVPSMQRIAVGTGEALDELEELIRG